MKKTAAGTVESTFARTCTKILEILLLDCITSHRQIATDIWLAAGRQTTTDKQLQTHSPKQTVQMNNCRQKAADKQPQTNSLRRTA